MSIQQRIRLARCHKTPSNCFGTALYIAGIIPRDIFIGRLWGDDLDYEKRIEGFEELPRPELYALAIFRRGHTKYIDHLAIVTGVNPVLLTQRDILLEFDGEFVENEPLEETIKRYSTNQMNESHGPITKIEYRRIQVK